MFTQSWCHRWTLVRPRSNVWIPHGSSKENDPHLFVHNLEIKCSVGFDVGEGGKTCRAGPDAYKNYIVNLFGIYILGGEVLVICKIFT